MESKVEPERQRIITTGCLITAGSQCLLMALSGRWCRPSVTSALGSKADVRDPLANVR
jgi:hypothetical protein